MFIKINEAEFKENSRRNEEYISLNTLADIGFRNNRDLASNSDFFRSISLAEHEEYINSLKPKISLCENTKTTGYISLAVFDRPSQNNNNFGMGVSFLNSLIVSQEMAMEDVVRLALKACWAIFQLKQAEDALVDLFCEIYELREFVEFCNRNTEFKEEVMQSSISWIFDFNDEKIPEYESLVRTRFGMVLASTHEINQRLQQDEFKGIDVSFKVGRRMVSKLGRDFVYDHGSQILDRIVAQTAFALDFARSWAGENE